MDAGDMPGSPHRGEQPGMDGVVHGLAGSTDSCFGTYQLCDYGQVPSLLPLSLSVLVCEMGMRIIDLAGADM